jgi:hypothetical protein
MAGLDKTEVETTRVEVLAASIKVLPTHYPKETGQSLKSFVRIIIGLRAEICKWDLQIMKEERCPLNRKFMALMCVQASCYMEQHLF